MLELLALVVAVLVVSLVAVVGLVTSRGRRTLRPGPRPGLDYRPGTGDDTRGWGPPFDAAGESAYFLSTNRNKLSLAADFSRPDDRALLLGLIRDADVVIDNFLPGVLARYGLDKDALLSSHERLIWCTISGFGPESQRPGYDFVVQAESGWMAITGPADGAPAKAGVALVDVMAGKDAATVAAENQVSQQMAAYRLNTSGVLLQVARRRRASPASH